MELTLDLEIPLSSNSLWSDVVPVALPSEELSVANIAYHESFENTMGYFRAVLQSEECSLRVFFLAKRVISLNPASYTAWHLRRKILFHHLSLEDQVYYFPLELAFCQSFVEDYSKNYQIWAHRRRLVEFQFHLDKTKGKQLLDAELVFSSSVFSLTSDFKNYHAWSHRQYFWQMLEPYRRSLEDVDEEALFCLDLLERDVYNNSAWNHRFLVLCDRCGQDKYFLEKEMAWAQEMGARAPSNEAVYNYIRALMAISPLPLVRSQTKEWVQRQCEKTSSPFPQMILVDCLLAENNEDKEEEAKKVCVNLAQNGDTIRTPYWQWRVANMG